MASNLAEDSLEIAVCLSLISFVIAFSNSASLAALVEDSDSRLVLLVFICCCKFESAPVLAFCSAVIEFWTPDIAVSLALISFVILVCRSASEATLKFVSLVILLSSDWSLDSLRLASLEIASVKSESALNLAAVSDSILVFNASSLSFLSLVSLIKAVTWLLIKSRSFWSSSDLVADSSSNAVLSSVSDVSNLYTLSLSFLFRFEIPVCLAAISVLSEVTRLYIFHFSSSSESERYCS